MSLAGKRLISLGVLAALTVCGCSDDDDDDGHAPPLGSTMPGDGLVLSITGAYVSEGGRPVAEFTLTDAEGNPAGLSDLDGNPSFVIGWVDVDAETGHTRYQSYIVRSIQGAEYVFEGATRAPLLESAEQVVTDSGGLFEPLGFGFYSYTFGIILPATFDPGATHTIATWASREDRGVVANDVFSFVPAGGTVTETSDVVTTATCNKCHHDLSFHGGVRKEIGTCLICHTDQTVDPESGENLDFGPMIHKIHHGENLTNLPYFIVGFRQSVHDYSEVGYPQDDRNCLQCHDEESGAADAHHWRVEPTRSACGGCHDDVNFETGENHSDGIQQFDDFLCSRCHRETLVVEFDNSVPGAHVLPYDSTVNPNLTLAIRAVQQMTPGSQPLVRFMISDNAGPTDITTLDRVAIALAGPTTDYTQLETFTVQGGGATGTLTTNAVGDYTYAPDGYMIPADALGTWSVGLEGRTMPLEAGDESVRFGANNPVEFVDLAAGMLAAGEPMPRRDVVNDATCDVCHDDLRFHGDLRTDVTYCAVCHSAWVTDEGRRPGVDPVANPPASVDFELMIHKIHRGVDLTSEYTVYGFGGREHNYNHVVYPGILSDCDSCHIDDSHLLPGAPDRAATVINVGGVPVPTDAVQTPTTAACTSCHDDADAVTHAQLNSIVEGPTMWSEACNVCHGEGSSVAVSEAHAGN